MSPVIDLDINEKPQYKCPVVNEGRSAQHLGLTYESSDLHAVTINT